MEHKAKEITMDIYDTAGQQIAQAFNDREDAVNSELEYIKSCLTAAINQIVRDGYNRLGIADPLYRWCLMPRRKRVRTEEADLKLYIAMQELARAQRRKNIPKGSIVFDSLGYYIPPFNLD